MAKYRRIFLEESSDHLAEISRALLDLEKEMCNAPAIDTIFRMAHSIKSMAASLGYDSVSELSHRMEDRMEGVRTAGRVRSQEELALLFRSLEALEAMVGDVSNEQDPRPADEGLIEELAADVVSEAPGESGPSVPETTDRQSAPPEDGLAEVAPHPELVGGEPKKVRT